MRVTSQFAVVLAALLLVSAATATFVVTTTASALRTQSAATERASAVVEGAERLAGLAERELAYLLAYLQGAAGAGDLHATRQAFDDAGRAAIGLAPPGSRLESALHRVVELRTGLFEAPVRPGGETLVDLLEKNRRVEKEALELNALNSATLAAYAHEFAGETPASVVLQARALLDEERIGLLEFLGSDDPSGGEARARMDRALAAGSEAGKLLGNEASRILLVAAAEVEAASAGRDGEAAAASVAKRLRQIAPGVAKLRASDEEPPTWALVRDLDALLPQAAAHGALVPTATLPGSPRETTAAAALVRALATGQAFHANASLLFDDVRLLDAILRGSLGDRGAALREATEYAIGEAEAEASAAIARAEAQIARARLVSVLGVAGTGAALALFGALVVRRLRSRIRAFDVAAAAVSAGRFDAPPPPLRRDDFDRLAQGWERMTVALRERDAEISHANDALRQTERMAALGSLVAGVAHEVNNPLAFVKTNAELALLDVAALLARPDVRALPEVASVLEGIRDGMSVNLEGIARIERTNHALNGFGGPSRSERSAVDLNAVADGVLIIAHNRLKNRVRIERDYAALPPVHASTQEIGQVVLNLLLNAVDASPAGGIVRLATREIGGRVVLTVADEGPGVPPEFRAKLFTRYATTKATGTGLGLFLSRGIAEAHGGTLQLDDVERGASFTLVLPGTAPSGTERSPAAPPDAAGAVATVRRT